MKIYSPMFVTCPYCGHVNRYILPEDVQEHSTYIYTCDNETGGCDQPFAITLRIELKPVIYAMKKVTP